jgi:hypothetical protein
MVGLDRHHHSGSSPQRFASTAAIASSDFMMDEADALNMPSGDRGSIHKSFTRPASPSC